MSSSSADDLRKALRARGSVNERTVEPIRDILQEEYNKEVRQAFERLNRRNRALEALTDIYPDILITPPTPSLVTLQSREADLPARTTGLVNMSGDGFYVLTVMHHIPFVFNAATDTFITRHHVPVQARYMGKVVREGAAGMLTLRETEHEITLPYVGGDGWTREHSFDYCHRVYRDREGRIVSYYDEYIEAWSLDEVYNVRVFGTTPWLLRKRSDEGICNIIFSNLHQEDTRRYIFSSTPCDFFMLQNEFFAVFFTPATGDRAYAAIRVVSCASRETVHKTKIRGVLEVDCCSINTRAIIRCGRRDFTDFIFFS